MGTAVPTFQSGDTHRFWGELVSVPEKCCTLSYFSQTLVVRGHFHPVTTHAHAAPSPAVILGGVIEEENAGWVLALLDETQIGITKEIRC